MLIHVENIISKIELLIKIKLEIIDAQKVKQNVQLSSLPSSLLLERRNISKSSLLNELFFVIKLIREDFKGLKNQIKTMV